MANKKVKKAAFTSIRILGKKAQQMLSKARDDDSKTSTRAKRPTKATEPDTVVMKLSIESVVRAAFALLAIAIGVWLVYTLRQKIFLMLLAAFVATIIDPGVARLERWGWPRALAVLLHYLIAIIALLFLVLSLIPIIAVQLQDIAVNISRDLTPFMENPEVNLPFVSAELNAEISRFLATALQNISLDQFTTSLQQTGQNLSDVASESVRFAARIAGSVVNFMISFIVVLVLAFFMQLEKEKILGWLRSFLPERYRSYADVKSEAIHVKLGQWVRGEALLMISIFSLTLLALVLLQMPYALTLALLAGFCEFIPAVGPLIAAIPALLIAGTQKGLIWLPIVAVVYYVIQWCENNLLVPLIMKRAVGLSPIAILFAMMVGISFPDTVHPVLGVMLAIPTTTILTLFLEDWRNS